MLRESEKKKSTMATVCGILPCASYALKPCADDVQHFGNMSFRDADVFSGMIGL